MVKNYPHPVVYITDCRDDNTQGRLEARVATLFEDSNIVFVGVRDDIEAAINLVDIIDAYDGLKGTILVNVARRDGAAKKWPNGTPFGHFKLGELDIFTTIDGYVLSLVQKLLHHDITVDIYDIPTVVPHMQGLDHVHQERIINTQFRSFDYLPRLAAHVMAGEDLPKTDQFKQVPIMPKAVCWVDSFGNLKTNVLPEEVNFEVGKNVVVRVSANKQLRLPCYNRLKDIPDNVVAFTVGSSGLGDKRFLEIMQQGRSAAYALGVGSGTLIDYVETVD
jgi:hypothetical protein